MERLISPVARLRASLDALAEQVERFRFELPSENRSNRLELRDELTRSVRGYLIPRLGDLDGDVVAVVVGSTGSGKSTLVNTLAGKKITPTGALRPTTTAPVVWCHADRADAYRTGFLAAVEPTIVGDEELILRGVTLVDAPDFDSVVTEHREVAEDLLAVADLCVFVTSAQRYADAVPWEFLEQATRRGVPTMFVVNRLPADGRDGIVNDYRRHLAERGIVHGGVTLIEIEEQATVDGRLPSSTVASVREALERLADPVDRHRVLIDATRGTVADVVARSEQLAKEARRDAREAQALADIAKDAYADQHVEVARSLKEGTLIRAEVAARWQRFLGTGRFLKAVGDRLGNLGRVFADRPSQVDPDARRALATEVERHLDAAAARAATSWELDHAGKTLLEEGRLWRSTPGLERRLEETMDEWVVDVGTLVSEQGSDRKRRAQIGSLGVNAAAVVAIVAIFSQTGGLTGGELGVAAGAAALQQKLLEQVFGTAEVRSMVSGARDTLLARLQTVFDHESSRFTERVAGLGSHSSVDLEATIVAVRDAAERFYG
ncbi:MAG: dynamin family protein, partial [Acidimicrobiia bacterium]